MSSRRPRTVNSTAASRSFWLAVAVYCVLCGAYFLSRSTDCHDLRLVAKVVPIAWLWLCVLLARHLRSRESAIRPGRAALVACLAAYGLAVAVLLLRSAPAQGPALVAAWIMATYLAAQALLTFPLISRRP